ncbi:MAG: TlpA disulfide reductase family protein [Dehalococcoidia bacterium]
MTARSTVRAAARIATVAAIVAVVGGLFVYREVLPADEPRTAVLGMAEAAPRPVIGGRAPDFVLEAPGTGELVRLSDFQGRPVVLNFWATWCVPCRTEMPDLQAAYGAGDDVLVLGVNAQESDPAVQRFIEEFGLTFPVALDRQGRVRQHYAVIGLPATFFIDATGVIRGRTFGPVHGDLLPEGIEAARRGG